MKKDSIGLVLVLVGLMVLTGCKKEQETVSLPLLGATTATEITINSAVLNGIVLAPGGTAVTARGFCWSTNPDPTLSDNKLADGSGVGPFTGQIKDLLPGTVYYVRTWATNLDGTSYGIAEMFQTPLTVTHATLVTLVPEYVTMTSVVAGGEISDIGGGALTERGICWSTDPSPTIEDTRGSVAITGTGSGSFVLRLNSLEPGKTYYLRAYAINSAGVSYGPEMSFRTRASLGIKRTDFPGEAKFYPITFAIENRLYIGLGSVDGWDVVPLGDFWGWDEVTNQWTRLAQFPGTINSPAGFSVGGKGYVYTNSWTADGEFTNELWEYDPEQNRWTQKSSLPAIGSRIFPVTFSIGSRGYIGMGTGTTSNSHNSVYRNDLWEWDQVTDVWTKKADFPGSGRSGAAAFAIGNRGYVGMGDASGDLEGDFWEYDQTSDSWTRKADFAGDARAFVVSFSNGNKGYVGAGQWFSGSQEKKEEFWEYDQALNSWSLIGTVAEPFSLRAGGSVGNHGYFLKEPSIINESLELWIFPLTSEK